MEAGDAIVVAPRSCLNACDLEDRGIALEDLERLVSRAPRMPIPAFRSTDRLIEQYTSGSTGSPLRYVVAADNLVANLLAVEERLRVTSSDSFVSWLPLFHDMGLLGFFALPLLCSANLVLMDTDVFRRSPGLWMKAVSMFSGTVTGGPDVAYAVAARILRRQGSLDLGTLRAAANGGETIVASSFAAFLEAGAAHGLDPRAAYPVYGLAEATLAVSLPEVGRGLLVDEVDGAALAREGVAVAPAPRSESVRRLVALGHPIGGLDVRVVREDHLSECAPREVGEILVAGRAVLDGTAVVPLADREWLRTGDLGYMADGSLILCGRSKNLVIVHGQNIHPEDAERVAVDFGIPRSRVMAHGVVDALGRERLQLLVEGISESEASAAFVGLADELVAHLGVTPLIRAVPRGTLPRTTSGKLVRP
jgi:fatty-acyl-CoA synthase